MYELSASLVSTPSDFSYINMSDKRIKSRFLKARKIPSSFLKKTKTGFEISSGKSKPVYNVTKSKDNVWICDCYDYVMNDLKVCKHIIRIILYKHTDFDFILNELRDNGGVMMIT